MSITAQIAKQLRDVHFGGNWTAVNLKDTLNGVTWQQAVSKVHNFNTIAVLVYHINYYITEVLKVLQGEPLKASDKFAFSAPEISSEADWQKLVNRIMAEAEMFAAAIEKLDDNKLSDNFADPQYGNYYRNLTGIIEHAHYHLGQIVLIKKILNQPA
ncbi:MAG: DinB family protein [Chitinophagaceae bacterium]|nr:DinB family protein [Chitinophagaceae bacterium]